MHMSFLIPGSFEDLIFCLTDSSTWSRLLMFSTGVFFFFHLLYSSTTEFLFGSFFIISVFLINFLLCLCIVFLILLNCVSMFSCHLLSFLKIAIVFWILYLVNWQSPYLWVWLLEDYCHYLVVSCFLVFLCTSEFCLVVFTFKVAVISASLY